MPFMRQRGRNPLAHINASTAQCGWHEEQETLNQAYFRVDPESAECVQKPIDSRNSAIHNAYRISLRPSSVPKPRHPSLKVLIVSVVYIGTSRSRKIDADPTHCAGNTRRGARPRRTPPDGGATLRLASRTDGKASSGPGSRGTSPSHPRPP